MSKNKLYEEEIPILRQFIREKFESCLDAKISYEEVQDLYFKYVLNTTGTYPALSYNMVTIKIKGSFYGCFVGSIKGCRYFFNIKLK